MEEFKSKTGEKIRLASRSGHVVIVGAEFTGVPETLHKKAMAAGCIPKSVYDEVRDQVKEEVLKEMGGETTSTDQAETPEPDDGTTSEQDDGKQAAIIAALKRIQAESDAGQETTEGGNKLLHHNKPVLAAVSEYAGFDVKTADIEEALR